MRNFAAFEIVLLQIQIGQFVVEQDGLIVVQLVQEAKFADKSFTFVSLSDQAVVGVEY